jgi:hypothetical protein
MKQRLKDTTPLRRVESSLNHTSFRCLDMLHAPLEWLSSIRSLGHILATFWPLIGPSMADVVDGKALGAHFGHLSGQASWTRFEGKALGHFLAPNVAQPLAVEPLGHICAQIWPQAACAHFPTLWREL